MAQQNITQQSITDPSGILVIVAGGNIGLFVESREKWGGSFTRAATLD
jgi:hypothetical protein